MRVRSSEALVLRTYEYREADLIVVFLTRDRGKLRGVAKGVRRPKSKYGVSLERLALSQIYYRHKEFASLVTVQQAELAGPWNLWRASYPTAVLLDLIAEAADRLLPENDADERYFRLLRLIVGEFCNGIDEGDPGHFTPAWATRALVYFLLWSARLGGWLPPFDRCAESDQEFSADETVYFEMQRDGLFSGAVRRAGASALPPSSRSLAMAMLRHVPAGLDPVLCEPSVIRPLQQYLLQLLAMQLEAELRCLRAFRDLPPNP